MRLTLAFQPKYLRPVLHLGFCQTIRGSIALNRNLRHFWIEVEANVIGRLIVERVEYR